MALLERVALLIKANLNDLLDVAEQPEKLLKQLLLDMQNQFMQVKTQLAIAIANQNQLQARQRENETAHRDWLRKAELALKNEQEDLVRAALDRALTHETAAANYAQQIADGAEHIQTFREALRNLEQKIAETQAKADVLAAKQRQARLGERAAASSAAAATIEQRFAGLERAERVEQMLAGLKARSRSHRS